MSRVVALIVAVAALIVASALAPGADAKLRPAFGQRTAEVGETVRFHLGPAANLIRPPIEIHLVPVDRSQRTLRRQDPESVKVALISTPLNEGRRYVEFDVPSVSAGEYTAAIWFKGYVTDEWVNGAAGFQPLLTITDAPKPSPLEAVVAPGVVVFCVLFGSLLLLLFRQLNRPSAHRKRT